MILILGKISGPNGVIHEVLYVNGILNAYLFTFVQACDDRA